MNLGTSVLFSGLLLTSSAISASAATVNIGSFTFDSSAYGDSASVVTGTGTVNNIGGMIDGNINSFAQPGSGAVIKFGFNNNTLVNGIGNDLLVFELAGVNPVALSLTPSGIFTSGTLLETVAAGTAGNNFDINIFGFDLGNFGVAANAQYTSDLFLQGFGSLGTSPGISEVVAVGSMSPVPIPASLPLLLGALLVGGIAARRRH